MNIRSVMTTALVFVHVFSSDSEADEMHRRFYNDRITMRASSVSFPSGSPYRTALSNVVARMNNNPSKLQFSQTFNDSSIAFDNEQSEVWFSNDSSLFHGHTAITYIFWEWWSGDTDEADVIFLVGEDWTTSMNKTSLWAYGGPWRPFENSVAHEYGHAAGGEDDHEDDEYNIMGEDYTHMHCNGSTCRSYFGEDFFNGLVRLYDPAGLNRQDVSVTLFKWVGRIGEYSDHGLCKMYDSAGVELPSKTYEGQRRYDVKRGQVVRVHFTYENQGENTKTVNAGYYISTDSTIGTADSRFATQSFTLSRGDVYTQSVTVTLPSNLTSGKTYYLGVIVDYDNKLAEVDGANNAAYHIIKIR